MYQIKLEKFEGPLSLLLALIEKEELEITEISLSRVTEEFLNYLKLNQIPEEELADFLVIAAKLLLIKSRRLLPGLAGEEDGGLSLEQHLRMYKEFVEAAKKIEALIKKKKFAYFRLAPLKPGEIGFFPPRGLKKDRLKKVFEEVLARLQPLFDLPKATLAKVISIKEKIEQIQKLLSRQNQLGFQHLLKDIKSRAEIIVSFLALLELIKQRSVAVYQDKIFEEIMIKKYQNPPPFKGRKYPLPTE